MVPRKPGRCEMKNWFYNWWKHWWLGLKFAMKYFPFFWVILIGLITFYVSETIMENGYFHPRLFVSTILFIFGVGIIFRYIRESMISERKDLAGKIWDEYQSEDSNRLN